MLFTSQNRRRDREGVRPGAPGVPSRLPEEPPYDVHMRAPPPLEVAYREPRTGEGIYPHAFGAGGKMQLPGGAPPHLQGIPTNKTYAEIKNEYTHIWEMPLPQPKDTPIQET